MWKSKFDQVIMELRPDDPEDIADLIYYDDVPMNIWNRVYRSLDIKNPMSLITEWCNCGIQTTGLYYAYTKLKNLNGEYPIEVIYDYYRCLKPRFAEYDIDSWDLPYMFQSQQLKKYIVAYYNMPIRENEIFNRMEKKWRSHYGCIFYENDLIVFLRHYQSIVGNIKQYLKTDHIIDIDDVIKKKRNRLYHDYHNEIYKTAIGKLELCRDLKPSIYQYLKAY
jgi:hypothetical protein